MKLLYWVGFGFIFEPFETAKPSWAVLGCAEADTQAGSWPCSAWSLPSHCLLYFLSLCSIEFLSLQIRLWPRNSKGCLGSVSFQAQFLAIYMACSLLDSFCWASSFSPSPSPLTLLTLAALSRPLVPASGAPPVHHSQLLWDALSALPSAAPLETPLSALMGS